MVPLISASAITDSVDHTTCLRVVAVLIDMLSECFWRSIRCCGSDVRSSSRSERIPRLDTRAMRWLWLTLSGHLAQFGYGVSELTSLLSHNDVARREERHFCPYIWRRDAESGTLSDVVLPSQALV